MDGSAHEPKCKKCLSDCKTCSAATSCDTCPKADQVWNPVTKKCVVNKARSCKELLDRNQLPSIPSGKDHIDRAVELYVETSPQASRCVWTHPPCFGGAGGWCVVVAVTFMVVAVILGGWGLGGALAAFAWLIRVCLGFGCRASHP